MCVELEPELESRLQRVARECSLSVTQLVEQVLECYLDSLSETPDEWVRTAQQLAGSWPSDDFSDWQPPSRSAWKG
jgi:predicted transcriptional regulator